jgi:hypothetical protein
VVESLKNRGFAGFRPLPVVEVEPLAERFLAIEPGHVSDQASELKPNVEGTLLVSSAFIAAENSGSGPEEAVPN